MKAAAEIESLPLFPTAAAGPRIADPIPLGLPSRRKRTAEALQAIDLGKHPVTGLPLDPLAPVDASRKDRYPREHTCGTCVHLGRHIYHGTSTVFCGIATYDRLTRRWYPGCRLWKPIPDEDEIPLVMMCGSGETHGGHLHSGTRCPGVPTDHFYEEQLTSWPPPEVSDETHQ